MRFLWVFLTILAFGRVLCFAQSPEAIGSATPQLATPRLVTGGFLPPRDIFSLNEIIQHRAALAPRLIADHIDFPLMPAPTAPVIQSMLSAPECASFGRGFSIRIQVPWCEPEAKPAFEFLKKEIEAQGIEVGRHSFEINLPLLTFLANYQALCDLTCLCPDVSEGGRQFVLDRLAELYAAGREILRFKEATLNGMQRLEEMQERAPGEIASVTPDRLEQMVAQSEGMRDEDIRDLLDIANPEDFQELSLQRTAELLDPRMTPEQARERLANLSAAEAITLAAYFARSRLQAYANVERQIQGFNDYNPSEPENLWQQVGDCKHFAGLTAHYLNHVVKPLNPGLAHWYFGIQTAHMQDYHHAYVKAVEVDPERNRTGVFFFDPTVLADYPQKRLSPARVRHLIEATTRNDHYFLLKRYAEDLVGTILDPDANFKSLEIPSRDENGWVDLQGLMEQEE